MFEVLSVPVAIDEPSGGEPDDVNPQSDLSKGESLERTARSRAVAQSLGFGLYSLVVLGLVETALPSDLRDACLGMLVGILGVASIFLFLLKGTVSGAWEILEPVGDRMLVVGRSLKPCR